MVHGAIAALLSYRVSARIVGSVIPLRQPTSVTSSIPGVPSVGGCLEEITGGTHGGSTIVGETRWESLDLRRGRADCGFHRTLSAANNRES